ncbi:SHOCT domain-containing protein [Desulfosporosinus sp. PR]|uniref:SHOCT domain-containing protein n=1 Tax=Candidatus Desulfosporosinus nitrosoreducens TaxID=3401928 RepID=UPI002800653F|nr:SHOCT domain-containing protein [Desulfosporosinus sp. PR]MDQ7093536.1 SHOCT domain-containing protein [Desulfosporosinus sp. PR]
MAGFGLLSGGLMGLGLLSMAIHLILWVVIIVVIVRIFRGHRDSCHAHGLTRQTDNALEILRTRYAKGEIDVEEFKRRKQDLMS